MGCGRQPQRNSVKIPVFRGLRKEKGIGAANSTEEVLLYQRGLMGNSYACYNRRGLREEDAFLQRQTISLPVGFLF